MRALALVAVLLASAACGRSAPPAGPEVRVSVSGFRIGERQIGATAVIRNDGAATVSGIDLRITFSADGDAVTTERDVLPFCPPRVDCPWAQVLYGDHLGKRWRSVDDVDVQIASVGAERDTGEIRELDVKREDDAVIVRRAGIDGTAYLLSYNGDVPRTGVSFHTEAGERGPLRYSQELFERDGADRVRAFVYPGPIPNSVRGPAD